MSEVARPEQRVVCAIVAEVLRSGRKVLIRLDGSSMIPAIWPRDTVEVLPCNTSEVREGMVAVFVRQDRLLAHRIVKVGLPAPLHFITRGDTIGHDDPPIDARQLLGYVSAVVRDGRRMPVGSEPARMARTLSWVIGKSRVARRLILSAKIIHRPRYLRAI